MQTRRTLPGLLGFNTRWCGKYHFFPKGSLTSDVFKIITDPFFNICIYWLFIQFFQIGSHWICFPVSRAYLGLRGSCLEDCVLVNSRACPFRNERSPVNFVVLPKNFWASFFFFDWLTTIILEAEVSMPHQDWMFSAIFTSSVLAKWQTFCPRLPFMGPLAMNSVRTVELCQDSDRLTSCSYLVV